MIRLFAPFASVVLFCMAGATVTSASPLAKPFVSSAAMPENDLLVQIDDDDDDDDDDRRRYHQRLRGDGGYGVTPRRYIRGDDRHQGRKHHRSGRTVDRDDDDDD
jgi:hypothetical protein